MWSRTPPLETTATAVWSYEIPDWGKLKITRVANGLFGWRWHLYADGSVTKSSMMVASGTEGGFYGTVDIAIANFCHFSGLDKPDAKRLCGHNQTMIIDAWRKHVKNHGETLDNHSRN